MSNSKYLIIFGFAILLCNSIFGQEKNIKLEGVVIDETQFEVPYAAVGIPSKYIGTATTEEGTFSLRLSKSNLADSLEFSSIGYKTFKIKIQDYLNKKEKVVVLEEDIVTLSEVNIIKPVQYVKNALKNLHNTTISKPHQLKLLYRRFSIEDNRARFFVEHYMNVIDRGPSTSTYSKIEVTQGRKSADYRFFKKKQWDHSINYMAGNNPLRSGFSKKAYKWSKIGDTSYDDEDIVIIEGRKGKKQYLRFYIGIDTYSIYKVEDSRLNSVYIYKKNNEGKLYLSYHNREWITKEDLSESQKQIIGKDISKVKLAYRHEVFVLGIETDKKKIDIKSFGGFLNDIGDVEIPYDPEFWNNFNLPPETSFYKRNVKELESIFGVPLETQFNAVNN